MGHHIKDGWSPGATSQQEAAAQETTVTAGPRCQCGRPVDSDVARVFGIDGVVPVCRHCAENATGNQVQSTPHAITQYFARGHRSRGEES